MFEDAFRKSISSQSLTFAESKDAMNEVMRGVVSPIKLSAWLTALSIKGENADEIAGFAASLRENAVAINCSDKNSVDTCGTGGDGASTFNISTAAAFVASGAGVTVAKHGNRAVSSSSGSADILRELGVNINAAHEKVERCLNETGIAFLFAPLLHPAMKYAMPVRKELGFRTVFNIIGPLANPAASKRAVLGVFSEPLCDLMADAAIKLGFDRAFIVHGKDGLDEISTSMDTQICEIRGGKVQKYCFSPGKYGIPRSSHSDLKGGSPSENAIVMRKLLSGKLDGHLKNIVVLNAAAAILAADKCENWEDGLKMAGNSLESGAANEKLNKLIDYYEN